MKYAPQTFCNFSGTENKRDDLDINFRFLLQLQRFHEEKKEQKFCQKINQTRNKITGERQLDTSPNVSKPRHL